VWTRFIWIQKPFLEVCPREQAGGSKTCIFLRMQEESAGTQTGVVWAELISLNPDLPNKLITRRATERDQERFTIGRSKKSQLHFDDRYVSQIHCCLLAQPPSDADLGGQFKLTVRVQDSSANGTFVNGKRVGVGDSEPLQEEDILSLVAFPTEQPDGSFAIGRPTAAIEASWGKLVFGDKSELDLSLPPNMPFVIGCNQQKCLPHGHVVTDNIKDSFGKQRSVRLSLPPPSFPPALSLALCVL